MKKHRINKMIRLFVTGVALTMMNAACGASMTAITSTIGTGAVSGATNTVIATGPNVMSITSGCGYVNEPCVSVTICEPGTSTCQTIPNVLLDTGSYGLRLFSSAISLSLTNSTNSSGATYAECVGFLDGSSEWGVIAKADVELGAETASSVPIHILNASYMATGRPSDCSSPDASPSDVGFNGILGVGLFQQDCGAYCVTGTTSTPYYTCSGSTCSVTTIALANQVTNPVSMLPTNNNGVIVQLAAVVAPAVTSSSGGLILGIGTQTNNTLIGTTTFTTDSSGNFSTNWNGHTYASSFIDSGSNGLFFPSTSSTPACTDTSFTDWYCPTGLISLSAVNVGHSGTTGTVPFYIYNAESILNNNNYVASANLSGSYSDGFDWGLPFFFGRTVAVGIENTSSNLGSGMYWAY